MASETIADAYAVAHARAVRLAYAVAGAIEDYPMPVATILNEGHVGMLSEQSLRLALILDDLGILEPPANQPEKFLPISPTEGD